MMFKGSMVALVTPFKNGAVDDEGLRRLIEFQIENGTDVLCPCGTTGESATLSFDEHERVVKVTIEAAAGRVPVMAGSGSNNTEEAIRLTRLAKKAGATGCLLITPYYNRPTQQGLYLHFEKIAAAVDLPIVLYNVPGRTGVNMLPETVERLSKIPTIVGIKEASGSVEQASQIISRCGGDFAVISGDDANTLPLLAVGGVGGISVTANIAPGLCAAMIRAAEAGDWAEARRVHYRLLPLHGAMFLQTNPIPVKTAVGMMGLASGDMRLPLCPMPDELHEKLRAVLQSYDLLR